ncbi:hypothetical protein [Streptomyces sp. NPDC056730]|uniref:hypothetical protein n=1 Tax=unclassified Streptomyces TaxID=2593676 RepID=UPI003684B390
MVPLFGERWGGTLARTPAWPVVAVAAGACLGGGLAISTPISTQWPLQSGRPVNAVLLFAGSLVLVLVLVLVPGSCAR